LLDEEDAEVLPADRLTLEEWKVWCENVRDVADSLSHMAQNSLLVIRSSERSIDAPPKGLTGRRPKLRRHSAQQFYIKMLGPITVLDKLRDRIQL
jgi:hypothetical protein